MTNKTTPPHRDRSRPRTGNGLFGYGLPPYRAPTNHSPLEGLAFPSGSPTPLKGLLKNPAVGAGAFDSLIPVPQTLILSRRVSAVSKDGERISPSGANSALRYAAPPLLRVRRSGGLRRMRRGFAASGFFNNPLKGGVKFKSVRATQNRFPELFQWRNRAGQWPWTGQWPVTTSPVRLQTPNHEI